jgi:hypothetical protein
MLEVRVCYVVFAFICVCWLDCDFQSVALYFLNAMPVASFNSWDLCFLACSRLMHQLCIFVRNVQCIIRLDKNGFSRLIPLDPWINSS